MPEDNELSQGGETTSPEPADAALEQQAPPVSEPRQSEDARRVQAAKDAEIARSNRERDEARRELDRMRQEKAELEYGLSRAQLATVPEDQQALYAEAQARAAAQKEAVDARSQRDEAARRAAVAEARLKHKDIDLGDDLETLVRTTRNRAEFEQKVEAMAERKRSEVKERGEERARIREEEAQKLRLEMGADRVSTSAPGVSPSGDAAYRRVIDDAKKRNDPQAIIRARLEQAQRR